MGNSFCKKCYCNDEYESDLFKYNSSNNLYYIDINTNIEDFQDDICKYRTTPGPPIIVRDKKSYIKALTLL